MSTDPDESGREDDRTPTVPERLLGAGDWTLADRTADTVFRVGATSVTGHTVLYEDRALRERVREATDGSLDQPWRFFFATRLVFEPPLAPGLGPAMVFPTVHAEARTTFAADLRDRGFASVQRGRTERARTDTGDRIRLTKYDARLVEHFDGRECRVDVEGWLGVWIHDGSFRLAGGAYPVGGLSAVADVEPDPEHYRQELLDLIRGVA